LNGAEITDAELIESFEAVENARHNVPLTFFEFGTLAALATFARSRAEVWILEVGLGGRLDAVNIVEPDYSLITTVALDHQEWLGETVEEIAAEKAGIMRPATPAFYGDIAVPEAIGTHARKIAAPLHCAGRDFNYQCNNETWNWQGRRHTLTGLTPPAIADGAQMRNLSLALAALEAHDATMLTRSAVNNAVAQPLPAGRFQIIDHERHQWVLDVAHNPQAARVLRDRIALLGDAGDRTAVFSMLADKDVGNFVAELNDVIDRWIVCTVDDPRARSAEPLARQVATRTGRSAIQATGPADSFETAKRLTENGGRILICGSFRIVGPALEWLGLY
jgi:dihydrofolate synthase/folylpolyglutamate synthase